MGDGDLPGRGPGQITGGSNVSGGLTARRGREHKNLRSAAASMGVLVSEFLQPFPRTRVYYKVVATWRWTNEKCVNFLNTEIQCIPDMHTESSSQASVSHRSAASKVL